MPKRTLNVDLSDESYAGWERYARDHGVTIAATAEAIGLMISAGPLQEPLASELLAIARAVTAERRARRR